MPTFDFKIPAKTRHAIQKAWHHSLTKDTITQLEGAASVVIIMLAPPGASDEESASAKRDVRVARKRHDNIAKAATDLLQLLQQDEEDLAQLTLRRKTDDNLLEKVVHQTTVDDAISSMRHLARLASRDYPAWIAGIAAPKNRSSKSWSGLCRSVWSGFIRDLMVIYIRQTGELPTVTRNEHEEEGYSSPFISGLYAIHDVLPDDVHRTVSKRTLGSRALESLSEFRDGLTQIRTQIRRQQKNAPSSA